jgi:ankyrin repeat protein
MDIKKVLTGCGKAIMMASLIALAVLWTIVAIAGVNEDLIEASRRGDLPEVKRLLAKGADVNAKDKFGRTALISAAGNNQQETVKLLLAKGADVNAKDMNGNTAFIAASFYGHPEVVKLLLAKGADVNAKDIRGNTALRFAKSQEIQKILIKAGAK